MSLVYNGKVTIKVREKTSYCHNHGTKLLFNLFNKLISGELLGTKIQLPCSIELLKSSYQDVLVQPYILSHESFLKNSVPVTSVYSDSEKCITHFDALLTNDDIKNPSTIDDREVASLVLCSESEIFAAIEFDWSGDYSSLRNLGSSALIRWDMGISNADDAAVAAIMTMLED